MVADGGEGVTKLAALRDGVVDSVGGQQRKIQRLGDGDGGAIAGFFFALKMALQFDINILGTEDSDNLIDLAASFVDAALLQSGCQWAFRAAGEADEALGMLLKFFGEDCALAFFGAQLHFGDQAAEVLIAGAGGDQEGKSEFTTEARRHGGIL